MIDEIRKIKLAPILEKLKKEDEIKSSIKELNKKIKQVEEEARRKNDDLPFFLKENSEICKLENELDELKILKEEKSRIENESLSDLGMDFQEAVEFLQRHNVEIVLTEEDKDNLYSKDKSKREYKSIDDFILVHKTDYIPEESKIKTSKESKVKNKSVMRIGDQYYDYQYSSERDTIHFAVNGEVEDHEYGGNWHNRQYAILLPFNSVPKEQIGVAATQDTFLKGEVDLPSNAYILCPKGRKEEIEEKNPNLNIIEYEGPNVSGYADALVKGLGYRKEGCSKWGWVDKEQKAKFNEIMEKEGFEVAIPHSYSKFKKDDVEKESRHRIVTKSKLMKEKDVIKNKDNLDEIYFVAENIKEDGFDILVTELEEEGIKISEEAKTLIHNLYKLNLEEFNEENLSKGMPNTEETIELLNKFKKLEESDDRYHKTFFIRNITEYSILKEIGKENLEKEKQQEKEKIEQKKQLVLSKKMKDFELNIEDISYKNATEEEGKIEAELIKSQNDKINSKLKEKGIDKYLFEIYGKELIVADPNFENFEDIDKALQGKSHYKGIGIMGSPTLDFEEKEDETVREYLERLEKYTDCFSKYYDGHTVDESIKFDENGNLIEEPKVEKSDFEKVAKSKEAVSELQLGNIVQEIRDEMNLDKAKEEVGTEYDE